MIYAFIVAGVIAVAGAGFGWWQLDRANNLEVQLGTANAAIARQNERIAEITETNNKCRTDVVAANAAVDAFKQAENERARAAEAAVRIAENAARAHRIAADRFRAATPSDPQNLCKSAQEIAASYVKQRRDQ